MCLAISEWEAEIKRIGWLECMGLDWTDDEIENWRDGFRDGWKAGRKEGWEDAWENGRERGQIEGTIFAISELGGTKETAIQQLICLYGLNEVDAQNYVNVYWQMD